MKQIFGVSFIVFLVSAIILFVMGINYSNKEAMLRNQIEAKQRDNQSQLDNTIKIISQNAQVTDAQKEAFKEIIVGNAQARANHGGSLALMVQESVPNLDSTSATYRQLMNTITAARQNWTNNQTAILDLKRQDDNYFDTFPASFFVRSIDGRKKTDRVQIVTSTTTDAAFRTGKDDNVDVFGKK